MSPFLILRLAKFNCASRSGSVSAAKMQREAGRRAATFYLAHVAHMLLEGGLDFLIPFVRVAFHTFHMNATSYWP